LKARERICSERFISNSLYFAEFSYPETAVYESVQENAKKHKAQANHPSQIDYPAKNNQSGLY